MVWEEGECEESDVWCGRRVNVKRVMCGVGGG